MLERLDEVLENGWETVLVFAHLEPHPEKTRSGKIQWLGTCGVQLNALGKTAAGTGACVNFDPDAAIKGAMSQAKKKAAVDFGVVRYLQEAEGRADVAEAQAAVAGDLQSLKNQAFKYALQQPDYKPLGDKPEQVALAVAGVLGLMPADLSDAAKLSAALREKGVL